MGLTNFSALNGVVLTPSSAGGISANGLYTLNTSGVFANTLGASSIRLVAEYSQLQNAGHTSPVDVHGGISVLVETRYDDNWFPVAYQFEPYINDQNGNQRILLLEPTISTFDDGIDSIMFVGGSTLARISRQQGRLGGAFRVKVILRENGYGTDYAFASVRMSVYGEYY